MLNPDEKFENSKEQPVSVLTMEFDILSLLKQSKDAVLTVQHKVTGEMFQLCLNEKGDLCYLVPEPFGQSKKIIHGKQKEFILTDDSRLVVCNHAEIMRRKREEAKKNVAGLTIRTYGQVQETFKMPEVIESVENSNSELLEVLERVVALTKNYRVYKDSGKLYFVCNCKTDADGGCLKEWLIRIGGFEVWGEGTDVHFKKAYPEDAIWEAKWDHGLVVHN